jgi:uncharacterized protein (DUF3820 family)
MSHAPCGGPRPSGELGRLLALKHEIDRNGLKNLPAG